MPWSTLGLKINLKLLLLAYCSRHNFLYPISIFTTYMLVNLLSLLSLKNEYLKNIKHNVPHKQLNQGEFYPYVHLKTNQF